MKTRIEVKTETVVMYIGAHGAEYRTRKDAARSIAADMLENILTDVGDSYGDRYDIDKVAIAKVLIERRAEIVALLGAIDEREPGDCRLKIRLKTRQGKYPAGSVHDVLEVIPHGGYTDSAKQYRIADDICVASDNAEELEAAE